MIPKIDNHYEWGFVCGRISVLEGRLLSRDFFLSLVGQQHMDDLLQHLQDTFLREYLVPGAPWEDFSRIVDQCFYDLAASIRDESPSPVPADLFLSQGDYLNLKNALSGIKEFPFLPGQVSLEKIQAIANGDLADLPPVFRELAPGPGGETGEFDPPVSDIVVDGAYLRHLLGLAAVLKSPLITRTVTVRVHGYAVSVLWRALRQGRSLKSYLQYFLPLGELNPMLNEVASTGSPEAWPPIVGGEIGDLMAAALGVPTDEQVSYFEQQVANHILGLAADGRLQTAGPERVYAFLSGLQSEMQNLKLVVSGKLNRIDTAVLRQRLREVYG